MKMNMKKTNTEHCPYCTEVLFKNSRFEEDASFKMPCPHCKNPLSIKVKVEKISHITAEADNDAEW